MRDESDLVRLIVRERSKSTKKTGHGFGPGRTSQNNLRGETRNTRA